MRGRESHLGLLAPQWPKSSSGAAQPAPSRAHVRRPVRQSIGSSHVGVRFDLTAGERPCRLYSMSPCPRVIPSLHASSLLAVPPPGKLAPLVAVAMNPMLRPSSRSSSG